MEAWSASSSWGLWALRASMDRLTVTVPQAVSQASIRVSAMDCMLRSAPLSSSVATAAWGRLCPASLEIMRLTAEKPVPSWAAK